MKKDLSAEIRFGMTKKRHAETLEKAIREKKADKDFIPLCNFVKKTKNFFTSSCCSGRILLLKLEKGESKKDASFHKKWHNPVKAREVWNELEKKTSGTLWLKMEPLILHIGTNTLENANKLLDAMKQAGVKRGGLIVAKPGKFLFELEGSQRIALPVKQGDKILVEKTYLEFVVKNANEKMGKNRLALKRLEKTLKKVLS
ncbi:MAG: hypothetical protein JW772_04965 [Candidatus Diapherotrites archaeon]|nr:hypothetical protein [Candidatus Diapherotrites archaeon]